MDGKELKPIMPGVWGHLETKKTPEELKQGLKELETKLENLLLIGQIYGGITDETRKAANTRAKENHQKERFKP